MTALRRIVPALIALGVVAAASPAGAHPLGNFTVNRALGVALSASEVRIDYVADLAELPTIQLRGERANGLDAFAAARCASAADQVVLRVDGLAVPLTTAGGSATLNPGEAGLETLRLECPLTAPLHLAAGSASVELDDRSFPDRLGLQEVTFQGFGVDGDGRVPGASPTARLTDYSRNDAKLTTPGPVRFGVTVRDRAASIDAATIDGAPQPAPEKTSGRDALSGLLAKGSTGPWSLAVALAVAAGLGAVHGLAPGHGKTVVAASLVGRRGTRRQALGLALAVALSHTLGVFVLGGLSLVAAATFPLERMYGGLRVASALLVLGLGLAMATQVLRRRSASRRHDHAHHHDHDHAQHSHSPDDQHHGLLPHRHADFDRIDLSRSLNWRTLAVVGLSGGLVPSASAVLLLLGALQTGRVAFGAAAVLAFGVGMSSALVGVGLGVVAISRRRQWNEQDASALSLRLQRAVPSVAAVSLLAVGTLLLVRSVAALGV